MNTTLLASNAAFISVFAVFLVAFFALAVITLRWAIRRDRVRRQIWQQNRQQNIPADPSTNGRRPGAH